MNKIINTLREKKSIPLDRFINIALYDKKFGYYMKKNPFGKKGDFITAPLISNLFSEMIAVWCVAFWEHLGKPNKILLVELGPGDGTLCKDLIKTFKKFKEFYNSLEINLFEISNKLKKIQKIKINSKKVKWIKKIEEINYGPVIFFGNEFFDALPIKQICKKKNNFFEKYVALTTNEKNIKFLHKKGKLIGMEFEKVKASYDKEGKRSLIPTGEDPVIVKCDDVIIAIGQYNAYKWIEKDIGIEFGEWDMPVVDKKTFQSTHEKVFFGGDAAWGPENIIWAVAHGHQAAISIDKLCEGKDLNSRPDPMTNLVSQKMGVHEWSYDNDISQKKRFLVPHADQKISLKNLKVEVELGYDEKLAFEEAQRCLNCDVQTVFAESKCIECDACVDICPTDTINFVYNDSEDNLREKLRVPATNKNQDLLVSEELPTKRVMVKDEDLCVHCGLCAERCPTAAWDMQTFLYEEARTYSNCTTMDIKKKKLNHA